MSKVEEQCKKDLEYLDVRDQVEVHVEDLEEQNAEGFLERQGEAFWKRMDEEDEMNSQCIRSQIERFGKLAQQAAEGIARHLVGPIPEGLVPMTFMDDSGGRVLVAVLAKKPNEVIGGERDPFLHALKAFKKALRHYGPIEDIGC